MKKSTRATVAATVGAASQNKSVSYVYDYSSGDYKNVSSTVIDVKGGELDFYDYETSSHVHLKLEGNEFSGYNYHTDSFFSGTVNGNSISMYDYETSNYYNFDIYQ